MPRELLRSLSRSARQLRNAWYARPFSRVFADPRLWSLQRRLSARAFGVGLAICFVPLPVHLPLALALAMALRINVPMLVATVFIVNPLTAVPIYLAAFTVGCWLTGTPVTSFAFELSFDWLQHGLGPVWKPFLTGCLVCGAGCGLIGGFVFDRVWMWRVRQRYRARGGGSNVG